VAETIVRFDSITKTFGGVVALHDVTFSLVRGECHALMGENGAGKSTLGKVLAGIHRADSGSVSIDGIARSFSSPADAIAAGVGMVHQELAFCPDLSVAENLSMGQYPRRLGVFVDPAAMKRRAVELLGGIGADLDVERPMRQLSTAQEQLVQIASAVGTGANILVFDEPTSSLSEPEARQLFRLIEELKSRGVTIVYVSHRMPEVLRLCDRITVLRDGKYVGTLDRSEATQDKVVQMMIGRSVKDYFPQHMHAAPGDELLSVRGLNSPGKFHDISFSVRRGEIVGFAGLVGAGRSEIARAIFGLDPEAQGRIEFDGRPLSIGDTKEAMRRGIGMVPEDRKRQGLILQAGGRFNFSLPFLSRFSRAGFIAGAREREAAALSFAQLRVKTPSLDVPVAQLSGGNQQKVSVAKWLGRQIKLLIADEPTRGVDVGAKAALHELLDELAQRGVAILLISSELPEVLNLSTRILVLREGRLVGEISRAHASQDNVMRLMAGASPTPSPSVRGQG
jgi:ABC-type sugar transport system ATPase subunit